MSRRSRITRSTRLRLTDRPSRRRTQAQTIRYRFLATVLADASDPSPNG
jgi:hypothetical protein